jgi:hypothetical protein
MLLSGSPEVGANTDPSTMPIRAPQKLRLTIAPRPSFRALAMRSNRTRPPSSTRSVIDPTAPQVLQNASPTLQSPTTPLTPQERLEALYADPLTPMHHSWNTHSNEALHTETRHQLGTSRRTSRSRQKWTTLFTRSSFRRHRVRTKATLAAVFGLTLLTTLAIYLGLAATGISSGLMFHILFIIFTLALTTIFCHSLLTMCLLILKPCPARHTRTHAPFLSTSAAGLLPPEKPIQIVMAIDEDVEAGLSPLSLLSPDTENKPQLQPRPPPPIYGLWRDTKRMDPNLVHWAKLPPSPDTPTYEEAVRDIQSAVEIRPRPPSYGVVDGVLVREEDEREMDGQRNRDLRHDSTVHPLERERVHMLFGEAR